jgi:hypothetical protein
MVDPGGQRDPQHLRLRGLLLMGLLLRGGGARQRQHRQCSRRQNRGHAAHPSSNVLDPHL